MRYKKSYYLELIPADEINGDVSKSKTATVGELINMLQKIDPDLPVVLWGREYYGKVSKDSFNFEWEWTDSETNDDEIGLQKD